MDILQIWWSSFIDENIASFDHSKTAREGSASGVPMTFTKNGELIALCAVNRVGIKVSRKSACREESGAPSLYEKRRLEEQRWRVLMEPWRAKSVGRAEHRRFARERARVQVASFSIRRCCYTASANKQISLARQGYALFHAATEDSLDNLVIIKSSAGIDGWATFAEHVMQNPGLHECECIQKSNAVAQCAGEGSKQFYAQLAVGPAVPSMRGGAKGKQSAETETASMVAANESNGSNELGGLSVHPIRFQRGTYPVQDNAPSIRLWKTPDNIKFVTVGSENRGPSLQTPNPSNPNTFGVSDTGQVQGNP